MIVRPGSSRIRLLLVQFLIASLLVVLPFRSLAAPAEDRPSKLERQVQEWVELLAKQKPFAAWQNADSQIEALGPGTHGWLVLFTEQGKNIGYMVVNAVTDGSFSMGEYGLGPYPLFSGILLKKSLAESGLVSADEALPITAVKHYVHPFAAAWEVSIGEDEYFLDAKTAEQLPLTGQTWKKVVASAQAPPSAPVGIGGTSKLRINESFDAYERLPWLAEEAPFPTKDARLVMKRLNYAQHLRYVTEPYGEAMLYASPVIGYQSWPTGRLDLALDMEGIRFVPLETLQGLGLFYR